jgi:hypothetical protein
MANTDKGHEKVRTERQRADAECRLYFYWVLGDFQQRMLLFIWFV